MLTSIRGLFAATLLAGSALAAVPAYADETDPPSDITVSGYVMGVTDYRFRGVSLTAGDPAIQGSINVNHSSGFYVGAWASNLEDSAVYGSVELDVYGGWTGEVTSGLTADVGLLYYVYPNGHSLIPANVFEPYASLSTTLGPVSAKLGVAYAWNQASLGGGDNLYIYTDLGTAIPGTPISLSAHLGYTDGFLTFTPDGKAFDWSVGATWNITDKLALGVSYVGLEGAPINGLTDDTVLASLKLSF